MSITIDCPRHEGAFDCTSFCPECGGEQVIEKALSVALSYDDLFDAHRVSKYQFDAEDYDFIVEQALDALEHPSDSAWRDRDLWATHTIVFATPDIELAGWEYGWGWSNYRSILKDLSFYYEDDVEECTFGHWTYSKFYGIKIRVIDDEGRITQAFIEALGIQKALEDGDPIWDYDDYSELETEFTANATKEFAEEHDLDLQTLHDVLDDWGTFIHYQDGLQDGDEEELVKEVSERQSTWEAHYYADEKHRPAHCYYCNKEEEVA